jgi:hypothetical protein
MKQPVMITATELRKAFRAIPQDQRDAHQAFSIRIWRGLSWLERAESAGRDDPDGQFIALWIAFNAIYGRLEVAGQAAGERQSWQAFLAEIVRLDTQDWLGEVLWRLKTPVLRLIDSRFLFRPFWSGQDNWNKLLRQSTTEALVHFANHHTTAVFQELFERLYVLRQQVFHGAATQGSKLNRPTLRSGLAIMAEVLPTMVDVMIAAGPGVEWGEVCFPPVVE